LTGAAAAFLSIRFGKAAAQSTHSLGSVSLSIFLNKKEIIIVTYQPVNDRSSETYAQNVFESLYEENNALKACAKLLADSILLAHRIGDACWSLTLFGDKIRLNVGPVEALVCRFEEVFLVLDGSQNLTIHDEISQFIKGPKLFYPSVPGKQYFYDLPAKTINDLYPIIRDDHQEFIQNAAKRRKKSAWQSSFSPGVITYLNKLLGISLPMPSYFSGNTDAENLFPNEIASTAIYTEGSLSNVSVNRYERDRDARDLCIERKGLNCIVCGFNFENIYGGLGEGFIHVHHLKPLSEIRESYQVDPINDLVPVCPNCHAMIHRYGLLSIEQLREILEENARLRVSTA
jgi:5-methylcytosine-specific restriction protein A